MEKYRNYGFYQLANVVEMPGIISWMQRHSIQYEYAKATYTSCHPWVLIPGKGVKDPLKIVNRALAESPKKQYLVYFADNKSYCFAYAINPPNNTYSYSLQGLKEWILGKTQF